MSIGFEGDVVIVTGAGRGLGRAHARQLGRLGARVVVNDVGGAPDGGTDDQTPAESVAREIEASGGVAVADTRDGSTTEGAEALVADAVERFGRVDAVVANAGILRDQAFHNATDEDFWAVVDVHFGGTARVFRAAYRRMREQGYGRLVSTTSAAGLWGNFGQAAYASAKMAIVGLTRTIAIEGAKYDVRANVIAPAASTRMTETMLGDLSGKLGPELVSPLVAYLCHPTCEVTGQIVSVGGGRFARVAIGVAEGLHTTDPDVDFVATHIDEILAENDLRFPATYLEEAQMTFEAATG